jgi:hypothetical protein
MAARRHGAASASWRQLFGAAALGLAAAIAALGGTAPARAQGFAAAATPPRFEFAAAPGTTQRQVLEITHVGTGVGRYKVYTADWQLADDGSVSFFETLQPGSCRPWVAIERRSVELAGGSRMRYRFEVAPPADAASGECRFALMIESEPEAISAQQANVPMSGRIAVVVYVRVGEARPRVSVVETAVREVDGRAVPAVRLRNEGNATARPGGFVSARDAQGGFVDLAPESAPVLPGVTRWIALVPTPAPDRPPAAAAAAASAAARTVPALRWPLEVEGTLEIGPAPFDKLPLRATYR